MDRLRTAWAVSDTLSLDPARDAALAQETATGWPWLWAGLLLVGLVLGARRP